MHPLLNDSIHTSWRTGSVERDNMATFTQYEKDGEKLWMFQTYLGKDSVTGKDKRTKRRGFASKRQAQQALNKLLVEYEEKGTLHNPEKYLFNDIYVMWWDGYKHTVSESNLNRVDGVFKNHILQDNAFNNVLVVNVNLPYVQKIVNRWATQLVGYKRLTQYARAVFAYAVEIGVIEKNPFDGVKYPKAKITDKNVVEPADNYLSKTQLREFLEVTKSTYEGDYNYITVMFFRLLAFTGARKGELLALTWRDLNNLTSTISINKTVTRGINNKMYVGDSTKTKAGVRTLELDPVTLEMLKQWRFIQRSVLFENGFNVIKTQKSQLIFSRYEDNGLINVMTPNHWLKKILKNSSSLPRITVHGFRHTYATLAIEAGMNVKQLQTQLGHSDIKTTLDIYTAVTEKSKHETTSIFANYVSQLG